MWRNFTPANSSEKHMLCNKCYCHVSKIKAREMKTHNNGNG
jgi:hypothetical protein